MLTPKYLNIPTMKATRTWSFDSVRGCCITNDYYTNGSSHDYEEMLDFVHENEPTKENIYAVALDIAVHSNLEARYGCTTEEAIEAVLFELYDRAITTTIQIER